MIARRTVLGASVAAPMLMTAASAFAQGTPLADITGDAVPITRAERLARIARAQAPMRANGIAAVLIEAGTSLIYYAGMRWGRSERLTGLVIPATGAPAVITPFFEKPTALERLGIEADVRVWQEHENPFAVVAAFLKERGVTGGRIGIEETVRFFVSDGLRQAMPGAQIVSADPVVRVQRMIKSASEIALMQKATDVTIAAYRHTLLRIRVGMGADEIAGIMNDATRTLGGVPQFALVLLNEAAAYPHGSDQPQKVIEGGVVLMDCGCTVEGYQADVSRTFVLGRPKPELARVWQQMKQGQTVAFAAAKVGAPAGAVDDAVRRYYESIGYGPDYDLPGLSHRTGHGIGLDGHEPTNLVRGETTALAPGMCFSNEPGLYLPGKFGVRIEDCFYMTQAGPRYFSQPQPAMDAV
ncbi:M24 family metallopeptidase [Sphingomonas sp. AX6]|uniref:M24 family metallopeptidase n=1 Tax=Sphingomonas sp. AX6 TaxID=2653171 RepID=UPI0012EFED2F|nr:Xaa-Pro peptidase family protein [Sphingomonas sp. AX6]VXC92879.1 Aminopeptidase P family protein [Sphingomonas sp. AX6]